LHGVNGGTLHSGDTLDLSDAHRQLQVPLTRLHDCHWPNADVVDIHVLFPNPDADPELPESYNFSRTDDYVQSIVNTDSQIVFRLGESIEHTHRKYHVHPPADADKWAAICLGIVRHYNDEWANGFRHNIQYWEIWNEPENRPAMWTGSDEDYFRIYAAAAKAIKTQFPDLRVGGPAVGFAGELNADRLTPSPFVRGFLDRCRNDADIHGFGMFSEHGVPHKNFESFKLFAMLLQTTSPLSVSGNLPDAVAVLAGINPDRTQCTVFVSNHSQESYNLTVNLASWPQGKRMEWQIDSLEPNAKVTPESITGDSLTLQLQPHSVMTIHRK